MSYIIILNFLFKTTILLFYVFYFIFYIFNLVVFCFFIYYFFEKEILILKKNISNFQKKISKSFYKIIAGIKILLINLNHGKLGIDWTKYKFILNIKLFFTDVKHRDSCIRWFKSHPVTWKINLFFTRSERRRAVFRAIKNKLKHKLIIDASWKKKYDKWKVIWEDYYKWNYNTRYVFWYKKHPYFHKIIDYFTFYRVFHWCYPEYLDAHPYSRLSYRQISKLFLSTKVWIFLVGENYYFDNIDKYYTRYMVWLITYYIMFSFFYYYTLGMTFRPIFYGFFYHLFEICFFISDVVWDICTLIYAFMHYFLFYSFLFITSRYIRVQHFVFKKFGFLTEFFDERFYIFFFSYHCFKFIFYFVFILIVDILKSLRLYNSLFFIYKYINKNAYIEFLFFLLYIFYYIFFLLSFFIFYFFFIFAWTFFYLWYFIFVLFFKTDIVWIIIFFKVDTKYFKKFWHESYAWTWGVYYHFSLEYVYFFFPIFLRINTSVEYFFFHFFRFFLELNLFKKDIYIWFRNLNKFEFFFDKFKNLIFLPLKSNWQKFKILNFLKSILKNFKFNFRFFCYLLIFFSGTFISFFILLIKVYWLFILLFTITSLLRAWIKASYVSMLGYMHVKPFKCPYGYRGFFFKITYRNYILDNLEFFRHNFLHLFEYFWAGYFFQSFFSDVSRILVILLETIYLNYASNRIVCRFLRFFFPFLKSIIIEKRNFTEEDLKILNFLFSQAMLNSIEKFSFINFFYRIIFFFFIFLYDTFIKNFYYNIFFSLRLRVYFYNQLYKFHKVLIHIVLKKRFSWFIYRKVYLKIFTIDYFYIFRKINWGAMFFVRSIFLFFYFVCFKIYAFFKIWKYYLTEKTTEHYLGLYLVGFYRHFVYLKKYFKYYFRLFFKTILFIFYIMFFILIIYLCFLYL